MRIDVRSRSVWRVLAFLPPDQLALYGTARSLIDWHSRHRFCANCGAPTRIAKGGWQRDCGGCGAQHFPRTDPVVIMLAEHDGHALVGRQAAWPRGNMSALAGFIEPGEAMEEAVARELHEEAGVRVVPGGVRYVASQPWPFPSQLMIGCVAKVEGRDIIIDHNELETAMWVSKSDVRAALRGEDGALFKTPPPFAIAHNLLMHWATS
jgi:NAD+ diphosphatase